MSLRLAWPASCTHLICAHRHVPPQESVALRDTGWANPFLSPCVQQGDQNCGAVAADYLVSKAEGHVAGQAGLESAAADNSSSCNAVHAQQVFNMKFLACLFVHVLCHVANGKVLSAWHVAWEGNRCSLLMTSYGCFLTRASKLRYIPLQCKGLLCPISKWPVDIQAMSFRSPARHI